MRRISPKSLHAIGMAIFERAGCSPADARTVVDHLVESSLFGHDSHGILRFYEYVPFIERGIFDPRGTPRVIDERACTAVVDGGGALGQIGGAFATRIAIAKAHEHGVATVTIRNTSHLGRIGAYPLQVAREGLVGTMFVNAGHLGRQITPYGGIDGKLSTNPLAFAAPRRDAEPFMVDMTTSMTAEGKIRLARNRRAQVPAGWLIDAAGQPTTDPNDYLGDPPGAMLPLGGVAAHKGYCLSIAMEVLAGAIGGEGCANGARRMTSNGALLTVYHIEHFRDLDGYYDELATLEAHIRTSRVDPALGEIQMPGEPEFRCADQRRRDGIPVDETTWANICSAGKKLGLDAAAWPALTAMT